MYMSACKYVCVCEVLWAPVPILADVEVLLSRVVISRPVVDGVSGSGGGGRPMGNNI